MLLTKEQLMESLKTLNSNVFKPLGVLLLNETPQKTRKDRLRHLLSESLLLESIVSDEVLECTDEMFKQFLNEFNNRSKERTDGNINVSGKLGEKSINATLSWTNCVNIEDVTPPEGESIYRGKGLLILVNITFCLYKNSIKGGKYLDEIERALLHEVNHVFEQMTSGFGYFHGEVMAVAKTYLHSKNVYDRMLAHIIYASDESEQNAMCAELYRHCVQERNLLNRNGQYEIKPSAYEWLENLYIAHDFLIKHRNDVQMKDALRKYSNVSERDPREFINDKYQFPRTKKPYDRPMWDYKKFKQRSDAAINRFEKRIAQTLKKAQKKILGECYCLNLKHYESLF